MLVIFSLETFPHFPPSHLFQKLFLLSAFQIKKMYRSFGTDNNAERVHILKTGIPPASMEFLKFSRNLFHPAKKKLPWHNRVVFQIRCKGHSLNAVRTGVAPPLIFHKFPHFIFCLFLHPFTSYLHNFYYMLTYLLFGCKHFFHFSNDPFQDSAAEVFSSVAFPAGSV